jgi:hypothetical protein
LCFFLTEGLKLKVLQSTWTNAKQKKAHGPMPKLGESAGTKHTFKPLIKDLTKIKVSSLKKKKKDKHIIFGITYFLYIVDQANRPFNKRFNQDKT